MAIVRAVGASANSVSLAGKDTAARIQAAMVLAIEKAQAEGISDQAEIRRRMMAARAAVKTV